MTEQEQIDALKAQVNCLREGLSLALVKIADDDDNDIEFMDVYKYLNTTPEQCLAEVKAKAIEDAIEYVFDVLDNKALRELIRCVKQLREQAK